MNTVRLKYCKSKHSACFAFSEEEYGQNGCLEGDIEEQGLVFEDFFSMFWNEKKLDIHFKSNEPLSLFSLQST